MGEGHLFQDPLSRLDWTPGWDREQITLGDCKDPGNWGKGLGLQDQWQGWGRDPSLQKTQSVTHTQAHTGTHTLASHTRRRGLPWETRQ